VRPPNNDNENDRFFVEGLYTGHFRKTPQNDCDTNPNNCTGHFADFPCGWTSYFKQQSHHLGIYLESNGNEKNGGYTYTELQEMWMAANVTKSNIMGLWWTPEKLFQQFQGTHAEMMRVQLTSTTEECQANRISRDDICSDDYSDSIGDPRGSCSEPLVLMEKVISAGLYDATYLQDDTTTATQSPSYEFLKLFRITAYQQNVMLDNWLKMGSQREAVCQWVVDNIEYLEETFIPRTYPRVLKEASDSGSLYHAALTIACIAAVLVLCVGLAVYYNRTRRTIKVAQVEFLFLILCGSFTISIGAIIKAISPTDASCIASAWLIDIGYTLELVPLIVKIAAINQLMQAAQKMKRVTLNRTSLFGAVVIFLFVIIIFQGLWTGLDPLQKEAQYLLSPPKMSEDDNVVFVSYHCSSNSSIWQYISTGWILLLLVCESVLAFQSRNLRQDFNESQVLAFMIYSHVVFVLIRAILLLAQIDDRKIVMSRMLSIVYSIDTIMAMIIYFIPKFFMNDNNKSTLSLGISGPNMSNTTNTSQGVLRESSTSQQNPPDAKKASFGNELKPIAELEAGVKPAPNKTICDCCGKKLDSEEVKPLV